MTREEIIEMAKQAGFDPHDMSSDFTCNLDNIEAFATLIAEHEREACAKEAETTFYSVQAAENIRAKGQE